MSLLSFPNELLLLVGGYCDSKTLHSLILSNRLLHVLLIPALHKLAPQDKGHFTALTWAASRGYLPLVKLLIEQGVDLECRDSFGTTALQWAVIDGNEAMIRTLIDAGADIHARDQHWLRPIDRARQHARWGYSRIDIYAWDKSYPRGPHDRSKLKKIPYRELGGAITKLLLESGADPAPPPPPRVTRRQRFRQRLMQLFDRI